MITPCDRRSWLAWVAAAAAGGSVATRPAVDEAARPGRASQEPARPALPPSIARIGDVAIDDRVEPALVFVTRRPRV